ncbi:MAG: SGNH/GDSL hydrolase family protein [Bacteroidota bacterium]
MTAAGKYKKYILLILFNIVSVSVLMLLFEMIIRIAVPSIHPLGTERKLMTDRMYGSSAGLKPSVEGKSNGAAFATDQYGFRKNSVAVDTSKESILLLGDSVTMGIGVESDSVFSARLQRARPDVNVLNPSLVGYDIGDYSNLLDHFLVQKQFHLRKVFVFFCLNDVYAGSVDQIEQPGGGIRKYFNWILNSLRAESMGYQFLKDLFTDRQKSYFDYDSRFYNTSNTSFNHTVSMLAEMKKRAEGKNVELKVILLPYEYQLREPRTASVFFPQQLLTRELSKWDIHAFSLLQQLHLKNSKDYYLFGDGIHFSEAGHRLISEQLLLHSLF